MTKIDIYSGFLGAGKTTLITKMIQEAYKGEKLVLIENEFGEIGIDGGFLKEAGIEITEMNSGCICCSLVGDFGKALNQVLDQYNPDRIIIEPSGVGKLSDVIAAVKRVLRPGVELGNCVAVVINFSGTTCTGYRLGIPKGKYRVLFNTDLPAYGGSGQLKKRVFQTQKKPSHGKEYSISIELPALTCVYLEKTE